MLNSNEKILSTSSHSIHLNYELTKTVESKDVKELHANEDIESVNSDWGYLFRSIKSMDEDDNKIGSGFHRIYGLKEVIKNLIVTVKYQ